MVAASAPVLGAVSRTCGWLLGGCLGASVELQAHAPPGASLRQLLTARLDDFSLSVDNAQRLLPFESFTLDGSDDLQLGWKLPALIMAPFWIIFARRLAPYLFMLLIFGPAGPRSGSLPLPTPLLPNSYPTPTQLVPSSSPPSYPTPTPLISPRSGSLSYDLLVREADLNRGVWPRVLSWVLTTITSASLPGVVLSLAESESIGDGTVIVSHATTNFSPYVTLHFPQVITRHDYDLLLFCILGRAGERAVVHLHERLGLWQ